MGLNSIDYLRTAKELVEKAAEQLQEAAKGPLLLSDEARQLVLGDIHQIQLTVSLMRRDLVAIERCAHRKGRRARGASL
jgi:hypothetical protein